MTLGWINLELLILGSAFFVGALVIILLIVAVLIKILKKSH